jgi:adenylylsulfate kinase
VETGKVCNPYDEVREELKETYENVKTIFIDCPVETLIDGDAKGLYRRALLPEGRPEKISNPTGINDPFDIPASPDLYINTDLLDIQGCTSLLCDFIIDNN